MSWLAIIYRCPLLAWPCSSRTVDFLPREWERNHVVFSKRRLKSRALRYQNREQRTGGREYGTIQGNLTQFLHLQVAVITFLKRSKTHILSDLFYLTAARRCRSGNSRILFRLCIRYYTPLTRLCV
jgi:hypothetical protein